MARTKYLLTQEVQNQICACIRAGGYPRVAAEAAGIPADIFEKWLTKGRAKRAHTNYRRFFEEVTKAKAQARIAAEVRAFEKYPLAWLKGGPGKETKTNPGWTTTIKPQVTNDNRQLNVLLSPELMGLFASLLQILAPWPEARAAVAQAMAQGQKAITNKPQEAL